MKQKAKALLVSMPWADFQFPSSQVGCLTSYARQNNLDVEGRHLFLEVAASFGLSEYDKIVYTRPRVGELFFAALLFPERKADILKYLNKHIAAPRAKLERLSKVIDEIYNKVGWEKYDLVGFSVCYEQLFSSLLFAKWLKRDFQHIKILFGGVHVAASRGTSVLNCFPQVDWCVDGEGEVALANILSSMSEPIDNVGDHVPGLIYRSRRGIQVNPRQQLDSLDELSDPDYEHYFQELENNPLLRENNVLPFLTIEGSRGCPHHCAFCTTNVYWSGYRARDPGRLATQVYRLSKRYRVNRFQFNDSSIPPGYGKKFFSSILQQRCDYQFFYEVRPEISRSILEVMKRAGTSVVQFGIESLSTNLLRKMNKGTRAIDNIKVMKFCEEVGIRHISNLLVSFPTETQDDVNETVSNIEYACAYCPPIRIVPFFLYDGIIVHRNPEKYGIFKVRNARPHSYLLPPRIAKKLSLIDKEYSSRMPPRDYTMLTRRFDEWQLRYDQAAVDNKKLLSYYDCREYLSIEDYRYGPDINTEVREGMTSICLEGNARELYLFCDSYKNFNEIKKRFPKWDEKEIKKVLNKLVKLKVMFREDDDYLSLAIRANGPKI